MKKFKVTTNKPNKNAHEGEVKPFGMKRCPRESVRRNPKTTKRHQYYKKIEEIKCKK
jgi:hypothetical protein